MTMTSRDSPAIWTVLGAVVFVGVTSRWEFFNFIYTRIALVVLGAFALYIAYRLAKSFLPDWFYEWKDFELVRQCEAARAVLEAKEKADPGAKMLRAAQEVERAAQVIPLSPPPPNP
jgi:hypothetical protein